MSKTIIQNTRKRLFLHVVRLCSLTGAFVLAIALSILGFSSKSIASANADVVTTWNPATKTLTMNQDALSSQLHADIMNHVDEMQVFDFGYGHKLIAELSMGDQPFFTQDFYTMNTALTTINGSFEFAKPSEGYYSNGLLQSLFYGCTKLSNVSSLKNWVFPAEYFSGGGYAFLLTFSYCKSITDWSFLSSWVNQCSDLVYFYQAFADCSAMKVFQELADLNTSFCDQYGLTFFNCTSLEVLDISNWTMPDKSSSGTTGMFAVGDAFKYEYQGSLPNLYQIKMGNDFLPSAADSYFPFADGWNAYYDGKIQATLHSYDDFASYQASAKEKGWGATTYVKVGYEPYAPDALDGWEQSDAGWQYVIDGEYITGWKWIDDSYGAHWYYFSEDTYMATNQWMWDEENSSWYWLCSSGPMIRGLWQWIGNEWYGFWWDGKMCRGWVWDAGWQKWFYCYSNGVMARNIWEGPYWLNWEGIWIR